jgi:hypothetical protein
MHDTAIDLEFQTEEQQYGPPRRERRDSSDVWKWIAGALLGVVMLLLGLGLGRGTSRAEVREMLTSGDNPYIVEKGAIQLRLDQIERRQQQQGEDLQTIKDIVTRIDVGLGTNSPGTAARRRTQ